MPGINWIDLPDWVGHEDCSGASENEKVLIGARKIGAINCLAYASDDDLSYEYDELAVVVVAGVWYMVQTAGCSCPSPSETWGVRYASTSLSDLRQRFIDGDYQGGTLPRWIEEDIIERIDAALAAIGRTN